MDCLRAQYNTMRWQSSWKPRSCWANSTLGSNSLLTYRAQSCHCILLTSRAHHQSLLCCSIYIDQLLVKKAGLIREEIPRSTVKLKSLHDAWVTEEITKSERKIKKSKWLSHLSAHAYHIKRSLSPPGERLGAKTGWLLAYYSINLCT